MTETTAKKHLNDAHGTLTSKMPDNRIENINSKNTTEKIADFSYPWAVEHCLLLYNLDFTSAKRSAFPTNNNNTNGASSTTQH